MEVEGAKDICIELNSMSKSHNMPGWRIGMLASNSKFVEWILRVTSTMDSGMFRPMQLAAVQALAQGPDWFRELNEEYRRRRVLAGEIFDILGVEYDKASTGMFLWGKVSGKADGDKSLGEALADKVLYEAGVFITPGFIFG